jgi:hypothetical protein
VGVTPQSKHHPIQRSFPEVKRTISTVRLRLLNNDLRAEETAFDLTPARLPSYNISATTEDNLELRNAATLN